MSAGDIYDPDRVNYDKDLLRRYYLEAGYADFIIKSTVAEITKDNKSFLLHYLLMKEKNISLVMLNSKLQINLLIRR